MEQSQLNDLKQFIHATVSQATANMATKDDIKYLKGDINALNGEVTLIKGSISTLSTKIDDLDIKLDTIADTPHEMVTDHETRILRLEHLTV